MNPYDTAYEAFNRDPTSLEWYEIIDDHAHGDFSYIVRTPTLFVCAREVGEGWNDEKVIDVTALSQKSSHLHVTIVAGDLRELLRLIPRHIKTISFQKHGYHVHTLSMDKIKARLGV